MGIGRDKVVNVDVSDIYCSDGSGRGLIHACTETVTQWSRIPHSLELPRAPRSEAGAVKAWKQAIAIPTYEPGSPDRNPMFLEKRVYQGSSGRVYPLPFIDRIATQAKECVWQAVHLENEYLRLMILPEIGGRIHVGYDKRNGYDFFYRQNVIKPALVGLAGPWISGGVEFNWPQHHRPATFMPVEVEIEHCADGSVFVWCGDHDPMLRMKGMHGVGLHPGKPTLRSGCGSTIEPRMYKHFSGGRTWWLASTRSINLFSRATRVSLPTMRNARSAAFREAMAFTMELTMPSGLTRALLKKTSQGCLYRMDLTRPTILSSYANIPVPTSYMVTGTALDFSQVMIMRPEPALSM